MASYGISSWIVRDLPVDEAIARLADSGFTATELSADQSTLVQAWEREPEAVCEQLAARDLSVPSVHSPQPGRLLDAVDETVRQASILANVEYLRRMSMCGIAELVVHPTGAPRPATERGRPGDLSRAADSLHCLAEHAGKLGLRLAVENIGFDRCRPDATMAALLEAIDGLGDHVGLCLDVGHTELAGLDLVDELRTAMRASKLFSLHLHDVTVGGKDHVIPGEGRIDFRPFLAELDAAGFAGGRILEISPPDAGVAERLRLVAAVRTRWEGSSPS